ncbi:MAG TPA: LamG-like jellyroll fold domain-containing protein, partial [Pyrinomonadaceae bacterium]
MARTNPAVSNEPARRRQRILRRQPKSVWASIAIMFVMLLSFTAGALQNPQQQSGQSGAQERGARNAGVRPKRVPEHRAKDKKQNSQSAAAAATQNEGADQAQAISAILATADFDLIGLAVTAGPATQTVPKNTPTAVLTSMLVPPGSDPAPIIAGLNPNYRVRGELTGPSLTAPLTVEAPIGQPLPIPALTNAGDHVIRNLRVVDTGAAGQPVVTSVTPDSCGIVVIDRLLISEVHVNELSYDQIVQAGINIDDDAYQFFNFTLGLVTSSDAQQISIPVAFPSIGVVDPRPIVGAPSISGPGTSVPVPDVLPVMLEALDGDGSPTPMPQMPGGGPMRIPGVVVFPGRIGLLHQFFEAIVIVANGAPGSTPLVVRNLHAHAILPDNGTPGDASDDPLRIAETQVGGRVSDLELHGLGPDGKYGTPDDTENFSPGQSGQGTFLLEGLKEGLHTVNFELEGTLEGLPGGPVRVRGSVPGAVLVRDASFSVTFTHPSVVRAGQEYDIAMTMYNSGSRDIQGAFANLSRNSVSGAELLGVSTQRQFQTTIPRGSSATVKWRLRANVTGAVTASYVKVGDDVSAGLNLVTGVGDRNVPLSPDSLILPDSVKYLPPDVVEASRELLGQAWSVANAPPGALPPGVIPVNKQTVVDRAVELGVAGLRVNFGEPVNVSLDTLMRDWLGELQTQPDIGFADAMRETTAGNHYYDSLGAQFYKDIVAGKTPQALQQDFAGAESPRSPFISALITQASGTPIFGARFVDASGKRVGFGETATERYGELRDGGSMQLSSTDPNNSPGASLGQMLVVSNPATANWTLEINGWQTGTADISLLVPGSGRSYRQLVFNGVQMQEGKQYRVVFKPLASNTPALEEFRDGAFMPTGTLAIVAATLNEPQPRVVGTYQVTPDVVPGGDKYGRLVGLLFSKPMNQDSVESLTRYRVGGGSLVSNPSENIGGPIAVTGAKLNYGSRFVFLSLDGPVGPYIRRDLTVSGVLDAHRFGLATSPTTGAVRMRVSPEGVPPGAYLTGRVLSADGTPVPNATVLYFTQECPVDVGTALPPPPKLLATRSTDSQGRYQLDYVRNGDCGPLIIEVNNPITHSNKRLTTPVIFDRQHMVLDIIYLARGNVQGTVTSGGAPLAKAFVRVVPELDAVGTKVAQTDEQGHYSVTDIPVGNVSVMAVGSGAASNASGLAAGTINGPGLTATVNVSLQNISGVVRGRVVNRDGSPGVGTLVIAYGRIPGFGSQRIDGMITVGYGYAGRDGSFTISNLPVNEIKLEATDYVTGLLIRQPVQLTEANPEVNGIVLTLPGYGSISGRVLDEVGQPVAGAFVSGAGRAVRADAQGNYLLESVPAGLQQVSAQNVETGMGGTASAAVRLGETTPNINITVFRPASISGHVYKVENGVTVPASKIKVSHDGIHQAQTDNQGAYSIPLVPSNSPLTLRFVDVDKHLFVNINAQLSPNEHLVRDATIRSASIHGRITQPDGVTGTIAPVTLFLPTVYLQEGPFWGLPDSENPYSVQSAPNGNYSFGGLNPGVYRVSTSNEFFPTQVSAGGTLVGGANDECNLSLVSTLAGKIQGRVYQPDGVTPVGPGVQVTIGGGFLANVTARTDSSGHYEFAEVFAESSYEITATDSNTGFTNRVYIAVRKNEDAIADVRLLGTGGVRIHVVDGAGNPVLSGSTTLDGSNYPNSHRFAELTAESGGVILFDNLTEGPYAIAGTQNGLGGRVSATVVRGSIVDVTVQLQASGTIKGRVFMPGGTVPIGLADVELYLGGRNVGFTVTSDADEDRGSFTFLNVPTGDFSLNVLDNRTGRVGRTAGRVTQQGEVVNISLELLTVGAVTGQVTSNGNPVDHALVKIAADGSGVRGANLQATTDPQGRFRFTGIPAGRFTISVSDAPGGQTGSASGIINGTVEPLPDTVVNITLEPSVTLTGTVYRLGGAERVNGGRVSIIAGGRYFETATNESGVYRLSFIPLGEIRVRAEAPTGYDRGEAAPVTAGQAGSTVISDVVFNGTADISGAALDNTGAPLNNGTVLLVNDGWSGAPVVIGSPVINGRYEIPGAPAGHFSLRLTVPNRVGVGTAAGDLAANQNLDLPVRLEDAGGVTGVVKAADGATPVAGVDITLYLSRSAGNLIFYTHTNSQGVWNFENVPLGAIFVSAHDVTSGGIARSAGVSLATNGQTVDVGSMLLDSTPISVVSVEPANGSTLLPTSGTIVKVIFSEPAASGTVNSSTVQLQQVSAGTVGAGITLSADGLTATLTPTNRLAETATFKVVVDGVEDSAGLRLANAFNSTFTTADETAPIVTTIAPANSATEIPVDSQIVVTFSEPIDRSANLADIIKVAENGAPGAPLAGAYVLDTTGRIATFTPAGGLSESSAYTVTVNGQRDPSGNVQTQPAVNTFTTLDRTAPVVDPLPIDGTRIRAYRPTITATYHDNLSGIKTSSLILKLDNVNVTASAIVTGSQVTYTPATPLSGGHHNITAQVSDNAGNLSALRAAAFDIDDSGPAITSFTIGGVAAVNGMYVTSSLQPAFALTYTDDTGINVAATQLLFAWQGSPLAQVPANVSATGLTYQPPAYLAEGSYAVQAVITNNLGTSSTTGVINFTLDVDAPEITSVTPASGSQHGGTSVNITGARLLSTTGAAPIVTIGGSPAQVLSAVAGSPDQLTLITPAGVPGAATIQMSTNRGTGVLVGGFNYTADPRTPFISEPDTVLLWHMDEIYNGSVRINDSGPTRSLAGTSSSPSMAQPGRFAGGRAGANIQSNTSDPALYFGNSGFTVEGWMKTDPVGRTYTIFGKEDFYGYYYGPPEYAVRLFPTGNLRVLLYDNSQREWKAEMPASLYRVDDNQWHYLAMVADRASNRLSLYVDGIERASSAPPAGFGAMYNSGQPFRVGKWAFYETQTTGGPEPFPGTVDEVRVSSTAHSAAVVQKTYLGTEGALGVSITNTGPVNIARGTTADIYLEGYNLAGATPTINGPAGAQLTAQVVSSSATQAHVQVTVAADAALGDAQLVMSSSQGSAALALRVIDLSRITLGVEPDTKLLWHMDETANGAVSIIDSGRFNFNGVSSSLSSAQPGRFDGGRFSPDIYTGTSIADLYFGASSFTVEGWMKTDLVGRTYTIFGKEDFYGGYYGPPEYAVRLLPTGTLRAMVYDNSQRQWLADMPASVYHVDDNQWHYVVLVVDRASNKLSLYVDGVERASSAAPANFGALYNSGQPFRVGHWALYDQQTTGGPEPFPGTVDEVRVSVTAHTPERILNDMLGNTPMRVTSYTPHEILRERAGLPSYVNQLTVNGYNLDGATARLQINGQTADAVVIITGSTYRQAIVSVDAAATVPLGDGQLVFSKQGQADVAIDVRIGDQAESAGFTDTVLLWNLNETGNGAVRILDTGPLGIHGTAINTSLAQPGHFGGGRSKPVIIADYDNGALGFNSSSFTVECWFKTGLLGRTYTLVGKEDFYGGYYGPPEYAIRITPSGGLRALAYDTSQRQWKAEMFPSTYEIDDNLWHHAAMVVDRTNNKLSLYVDGVERASSTMPAGFGALYNSGQQFRAGKYAIYDEATFGGAEEFPGVLDDIRISASAHTAEQVVANMNGVPGLRINSYSPQEAPRNKATGETLSTLITLTGFGLDGASASLMRNGQPLNATATVEASSFYQAQVRLSVNSSVAT